MIHVEWLDEQHQIIHYRYVGEWGWIEHYEARQQAHGLMYTVNHPVVTLVDHRESDTVPFDLIAHILVASEEPHMNAAGVVHLGLSPREPIDETKARMGRMRSESMMRIGFADSMPAAMNIARKLLDAHSTNP